MQIELKGRNKAEQATDAIKAALQAVREICRPLSICISTIDDKVVYSVLLSGKRDMDNIPGELHVKPRLDDIWPWRYSKILDDIEFYCYGIGGEEC